MLKRLSLLALVLTLALAGCGVSPSAIAPTGAKTSVQAKDNDFAPVYEEVMFGGQITVKIFHNRLEQWHKTVFGNLKLDATLPLANVTNVDIKKPLLSPKKVVIYLLNGSTVEYPFAQPEKVREIIMGLKR